MFRKILLLSFLLAMQGCASSFSIDDDELDRPSSNQFGEVELLDRNYKGRNVLVGQMKLRSLAAGDVSTIGFELRNNTDIEVKIERIGTSCSCVDAKMPKGIIGVGGLSKGGVITVHVPQIYAKNFGIAEVWLYENSTSNSPLGVIVIEGDIFRPYGLREQRVSVPVNAELEHKSTVIFDIDKDTKIEDIEISCSSVGCRVSLERKSVTKGAISIGGSRERMLGLGSVSVELKIVDGKRMFKDTLLIDFIDEKKLRVTPAIVEFVNGEARLIVYRKSGLDISGIKLKHGDAIAEAKITQLSETTAMIMVADCKLQDSAALTLVSGVSGEEGSEFVSIPITRN